MVLFIMTRDVVHNYLQVSGTHGPVIHKSDLFCYRNNVVLSRRKYLELGM